VVEGAGGVLVPLNETELMIDLIKRLGLPAVVVARSTLGTINHTLLTLHALHARSIPVMGVVMNGPPAPSNRAAIEQFGPARVLAEIPHVEAVTPDWVAQMAGALRD
jgi:malonyl-CoA O-methyltransferase